MNPAFLALFRYVDSSEAIGLQAEDLFVREDLVELSDVTDEIADSGFRTREFVVKRQDGSEIFVEVASSTVHDGLGEAVGGMASFVDVTERKVRERDARRQHLRLVRLTERMADLEERGRRRVSNLLHDTVVQSLSLSNIRLGAVSKALGDACLVEERKQLEAAREMIAEGIRQCRLVMADLTPPLLYEVGLGAAVKQFAERVHQLQGIRVTLEDESAGLDVPDSLRGLLFQAARELVMNACKHASPSQVSLRIRCAEQRVELWVRDDGGGFDPARVGRDHRKDAGGFGLFSISQRLARLGGHLQIDSEPGQGTEVCIVVPMRAQPDVVI